MGRYNVQYLVNVYGTWRVVMFMVVILGYKKVNWYVHIKRVELRELKLFELLWLYPLIDSV